MRTARAFAMAAGVLAAVSLSLTGCGGGSSTSDNSALVDDLMTEIGDEGISADAKTCIRTALEGYSTEELETLKNGESDADVPVELQTKVIEMMTTCIGDSN